MNVRRSARWLPLVFLLALLRPVGVEAQEKVFRLQGVDQTLVNVSPETDVYFRSMRLNRALNVWNVEVTVSNKTSRTLSGPVVLLIDSFQGTGGPVSPDGLDDSQPGKGFYALSVGSNPGPLVPAGTTAVRTLTLSRLGTGTVSPSLIAQVYAAPTPVVAALGVTRSLDEVGRPLPGVFLSVSGPKGTVQQVSDLPSGVASFGQGAGDHRVIFSADGYLPVWRRQMLATDSTAVLPNPRLTLRSDHPFAVTPAGGIVVSNSSASIQMLVPPGAVTAEAEFHLTPVTGQTLPAFLPQGWSPLSAFWIESSQPLQKAFSAVLLPAGPIAAGESAALVRWNDQTLQWMVAATVSGNGVNAVTVPIESLGAYALVVADAAELAPPAPQAGQPLLASAVSPPDVAGLTATGTVTPAVSPASVVPERVTGTARVELKHATAKLPSGWLLRGEVTETYLLLDGSIRLTPQYEHFIVGYQRPGDADSQTLGAEFPMRPVLLFGPEQLKEATVRVDVLPEQPFDGQVLDAKGGQMIRDGVRLIAGTGTLTAPSALRLRRLDATAFTNLVGNGHVLTAAFDLTVDGSTLGSHLSAQLGGVPANTRFVLARILSETGYFGLQPVERLQSDAQGTLLSLEPASGDRLPGLRGSGQFLLVQVNEPQGLIRGVARTGAGTVRANLPVSLAGLPWLALTDAQGRYELVAPAGSRELSVRDPATGDVGRVQVTLTNPGTPLAQDLDTAPRGPRVAKITPAADATRVPRVGSVVIEFDEAVNPASVVNAIQLLKPDNSPVPAAMVLNLANRIATLSPATELDANTLYRVSLAATIADPSGLPIEGAREFSFTTVPLSTRDPAAQLIIYQPGATNVPTAILDEIPAYEPGDDASAIVVHGTPGVADPEVPVILVNESTGETATILSKPDGSFSSVISGSEQDFVSATFVNLNGTRVYVPVSRQQFDNGFVGLYPQGGILEAQSDGGPVQVYIKPNAVPDRTKFRIKTITRAQVLEATEGVMPEGAILGAGAMKIEVEGSAPREPMQITFPVNLTQLGYPTNESPRDVAAVLAVVKDSQGVKTFEVADQMVFEPSEPVQGGSLRVAQQGIGKNDFEFAAGVLHTVAGFAPSFTVAAAPLIFDYIITPLILGNRPVLVKGFTQQLPVDQQAPPSGLNETVNALVSEEFEKRYNVIPIQGAFVILRNSTNPPVGRPGRLQPGMVHATSGADGTYLMVAPAASAGYILSATHPGFTDRPSMDIKPSHDIGFSGVVFKRLVFHTLNAGDSPLRLNVSHVPQHPAPGQDCEVQVSAFRGLGANPDLLVRVLSVTNLSGSIPATMSDILLTNVVLSNSGLTRQWRGILRATSPLQATLEIVVDAQPPSKYTINFSGVVPPIITGPLPKPDTNDVHGPIVISTLPPEGGFLGTSGEITLLFNKPIDRSIEGSPFGVLLGGATTAAKPILRLDPSQRRLVIQYPGLEPDTEYNLTLTSQAVRDLVGQPIDQRPSTPESDSFRMTFRSAPVRTVNLPPPSNGRGSVILGTTLYVIDAEQQYDALVAYDIKNPERPIQLSRSPLFGQPRDLIVIPQYAYRRDRNGDAETNDLVVVVGGDLDTIYDSVGKGTGKDKLGNTTVKGQYLTVFNMGDPIVPEVLASPVLSYRVGSAVTKVRWSAPHLIYEEFGADIQQLGVVNLQSLIIGFGFKTPPTSLAGRTGVDKNGDGDYVDEGDLVPIPDIPPVEVYGKVFSYILAGTTQKILDFNPIAGGQIIGITLTRGVGRDSQGQIFGRYAPMYRTLGLNLDTADPTDSALRFDDLAYPRWVTVFPSLTMVSNGVPIQPMVALVSLQPDYDGIQKLAVIDISLPRTPRIINKIPVSSELLGGGAQSVQQRADGLLELAGGRNIVVLDPSGFGITNFPSWQAHPSIVGFVPSAGAGTRSVGTTPYGYYAKAEGGAATLVQAPPTLRFVNFPASPVIVEPSGLANRTDAELLDLVQGIRTTGAIPPARAKADAKAGISSDLDPPRPAAHFHVFVEAPGFSGETIELGLESVNHAGRPLSNFGVGFAPVRAISVKAQEAIGQLPRAGCGAPIRSLTAWRMSSNPRSPFYNRYLSRPFAMLANETLSATELSRLQKQLDREILHSGAGLRVFIDPSQSANKVLGMFAARIDARRRLLLPIASQNAITLFHPYLMGDNPPPAGGYVSLPATYGMVAAHSSEVRTEEVDMSLPSRRMPIRIQRSIGNQDQHEGPFGVGWDFNYGQRITELDPLSFPLGLQMPLIIRGSRADSDIAGSQDLLFNTGMGRVLRFRWVSTNMPPEYADDPLVRDFDYAQIASDYYLPALGQGVFDLLVKLKDGRFERLTSEGVRYRYAGGGRLEMIIDRFPLNRHELEYDRNGWLVRIDDRSVHTSRYLNFGYYRTPDDPDFQEGLDEPTANSQWEGKIRRLRNFAGGDVLFVYSDDGFLIRRDGLQVDGENGGFAGRAQTHYVYKNCRFIGVRLTAAGAPLFAADTMENSNGKPVVLQGGGIGGMVGIDIPANNSAASLNGQTSIASLADQSRAAFQFDSRGHLKSVQSSGPSGAPSETVPVSNVDGLLTSIRHPEGNSETLVYDTENSVFRSRANLLRHTIDPGPRGGEGYTQEFRYDPRYNLRSGVQHDANGFEITYRLQPDGRALERIEYGQAGSEILAYNDYGQLISQANPHGVITSTTYDPDSGFEKSHRVGTNEHLLVYGGDYASRLGQAAEVALPVGAPVRRKYNRKLQVVEMSRADLREVTGYDELGRSVFQQRFLGDGKAPVIRQEFDEKGFLKRSVTEGIEVGGAVESVEYVFTPDELSRVKSVRLPQGSVQVHDYDPRGQLIRRTVGDYIEEYGFDLNGNGTWMKKGGDLVETRVYDGLDRPVTITAETGGQQEILELGYFRGGQPKSRVLRDGQFGVVESMAYGGIDELGRPTSMTVSGTTVTPEYRYQYEPNAQTVIGPRMTIQNNWNAAGHPTRRKTATLTESFTPDGNGKVREVERTEDGAVYQDFFTFDSLDNPESHRDSLGSVYQYVSRADGRVRSAINALEHSTTMDHSALGELLSQRRADGMEFRYQHDALRRPSFTGDPTAGFRNEYDTVLRLESVTHRDGSRTTLKDFDPRRQPQTATIPGGEVALRYDLKERLTERTVRFLNTTYFEGRTYDAGNRLRVHQYQQDGGQRNKITYTYDAAGPLLQAQYAEDGSIFVVGYTHLVDLARKSIVYPSGHEVQEQRDPSGRLLGISDTNGVVARVTAWQGNQQPKTVELGGAMDMENRYDARGRLLSMRAVRVSDGAVLAHMRYQYDAANNLQRRQFLHRGGRTDRFSYDDGERLSTANVGAVPTGGDAETFARYGRTYTYQENGLDYLTAVSTTQLGLSPPPFASSWTGHDGFLLPGSVDGFNRAPADPMGNVPLSMMPVRPAGAPQPEIQSAGFLHNGNGNLVSVRREDGLVEQNYFQPDGMRYRRQLVRETQTVEDRHFVYDVDGRLLEEYDRNTSGAFLIARYYYLNSDAPVAADLYDYSAGTLRRYYYLKDAAESVIALADSTGAVVERAWYDPFGQPVIESRDDRDPVIKQVASVEGGGLLIAFSEPVLKPMVDPGVGEGIVPIPALAGDGLITVSMNAVPVAGRTELVGEMEGYLPYSVIRFTPASPIPVSPGSALGWWPGDGNVLDMVGGNSGVLRGGSSVGPGLNQQAFIFNGTGAFVEITNAFALNLGTGDFTLATWVRFDTATGEQVLMEKWVQADRSGWSLVKSADQRWRLLLGSGGGAELVVQSPAGIIPTNQWLQVAARRQGNQFTILTNGVPVASGQQPATLGTTATLKFGSREGSGGFLHGRMDEVTLHSRALSDQELMAVAGGVSLPGPLTITLEANSVADEWGNRNAEDSVSFLLVNQAGAVYFEAQPDSATVAPTLARSAVGSPFLFHGQYFDYDTGLLYLRARFYDPYSGMFLEPDPLGYEDSVNPYAGIANNPVSFRDPSGQSAALLGRVVRAAANAGSRVTRAVEPWAPSVVSRGMRAGVNFLGGPEPILIAGASARSASIELLENPGIRDAASAALQAAGRESSIAGVVKPAMNAIDHSGKLREEMLEAALSPEFWWNRFEYNLYAGTVGRIIGLGNPRWGGFKTSATVQEIVDGLRGGDVLFARVESNLSAAFFGPTHGANSTGKGFMQVASTQGYRGASIARHELLHYGAALKGQREFGSWGLPHELAVQAASTVEALPIEALLLGAKHWKKAVAGGATIYGIQQGGIRAQDYFYNGR